MVPQEAQNARLLLNAQRASGQKGAASGHTQGQGYARATPRQQQQQGGAVLEVGPVGKLQR
jgi:hypothetical protein